MNKKIIFLGGLLVLLSACSGDDKASSESKGSGDHVWKGQTDAIDKAKAVEGLLQDVDEEQRQVIEAQTQ